MSPDVTRGLFPLDLVLMPGEARPLQIFELRYRQLFADCTLGAEPFVMVREHGGVLAGVGCVTEFEQLVQRADDGRLAVIVRGLYPVSVAEHDSASLYRVATCTRLEDVPCVPDEALREDIVARFRQVSEIAIGEARDPASPDDVPFSYAVAGSVAIPDLLLQQLLETRDENVRRTLLRDELTRAEETLRTMQSAQAQASTNGKVPHS